MYYRTTKLKRFKLLCEILNIISFPIRFPLFLLYFISERLVKVSEFMLDTCDKSLYLIMDSIVKIFKFNEIADRQYENNKEKFKRDCKKNIK